MLMLICQFVHIIVYDLSDVKKNMFFRLCDYGGLEGQNTTFHKTQPHFRKTLRHYRKHCSINVFWVM